MSESNTNIETGSEVRLATPEDATVISSILYLAFEEYRPLYTLRALAATTPAPDTIATRLSEGPTWLAFHNTIPTGTVSALSTPTGLYIRSMAVLPTARGLGAGALLLTTLEKYAEKYAMELSHTRLYLSTTPFLSRAIALYTQFGFQTVPDPPHELFGTPLVTMEKYLDR